MLFIYEYARFYQKITWPSQGVVLLSVPGSMGPVQEKLHQIVGGGDGVVVMEPISLGLGTSSQTKSECWEIVWQQCDPYQFLLVVFLTFAQLWLEDQ